MRVTNRMMIDNAIQNMSMNLDRLNQASEKAATGKAFQNASDDPLAASISLNLRSALSTTDTYKNTATLVDDWMSASDQAFDQITTIGTQAVDLVIKGLTDSVSADERKNSLAPEIDAILKQAVDIGNTSTNGQYLFAGYKLNTKPFLMPDADTIQYQGDQQVMNRSISPGQVVGMNIPGDSTFMQFFQELVDARNELASNDTVALKTTLTGLQSSMDTIGQKRTTNGARQRQVETAADYLDKVDLDIKTLLTQKEDVNLAEAISDLRGQETTYQSVLEVSQRSISVLNLFEYLQ